jgi:PIN domain nuclease of toxin-antitoxin system
VSQSHPPELLLDTHALLWWLAEPDRLSPTAHQAIADPGNRVHGLHAGRYPMAHRDPFDRLLAAQAELGGLTLVSLDPALQSFPCNLIW